MNLGLVLQSQQEQNLSSQKELKITYLQRQKQRLEEIVQQLQSNNSVLRNVIKGLVKDPNSRLKQLLLQNKVLESEKIQLFQNREKVIAQNFLLEQIMLQNQNEMRHIMKNYEEKIIELRRSMQMKQGALQQFENKKNILQNLQQIVIPPYNISMHFYAEFQEYKKAISTYNQHFKQFQKQNQKLNIQLTQLKTKYQKLQHLALSKCSFLEFRDLHNKSKHHSLPRKDTTVPITKKISLKKVEESFKTAQKTTRDISILDENHKINLMKQLIKKQYIQNENLKGKIRSYNLELKEQKQQIKKLTQSNKFHLKKRQHLISQLNYYKNLASSLTETLLSRKAFPRSSSQQKSNLARVSELKKVQEEKVEPVNQIYWIKVQQQLNEKLRLPISYGKKLKRSHSCMNDYLRKTQKLEEELPFPLMKKLVKEESNFFQDISIIGGSKKVSYADVRKTKKREEEGGENFLSDSLFD